jgi:hypothetical protein
MAKTLISDVIVPSVFIPYMIQRTADKSRIMSSGIAAASGISIVKGGLTVNVPFWKDLTGADEVLSDSSALSVNPITTGKDIAAVHARGKAWSVNDLARVLSGDDPAGAIADLMSDYWARMMQSTLISSLKGAFAAASMADSVLNISTLSAGAGIVSGDAMIDGAYLLGDNYDTLSGAMMHSAVMQKLAKLNLIDYLPDSEGKPGLPTYQGKAVIVDDSLSPSTITVDSTSKKAYPVFLFGTGSVAYDEAGDLAEVETDRDVLAGDDVITSRRHFIMHPRGIKWKGSAAGATPTNAELATGTNWELVYERKNVHIAEMIVRVD